MIWFDIKALESKISNNELSDKDGYNYVLAYSILTVIAIAFATNTTNGWIKLSDCIISVLITIWGMQTAYEVNNHNDGKDFLKRFFAIYWVIGLRLIAVLMPFCLILGVLMGIMTVVYKMDLQNTSVQLGMIVLTFKTIFCIICYLLIINSFKRLKTNS